MELSGMENDLSRLCEGLKLTKDEQQEVKVYEDEIQ